MGKEKTVHLVVENKLCIGCGACFGVCPLTAIHMIYCSSNQTNIPIIDFNICNECSYCVSVCPGINMPLPKYGDTAFKLRAHSNEIGYYIKCFVGHAVDEELRFKASSGGIASALSLFLLESGYVESVASTGMKEGEPLEANTVLCRTAESVLRTIGSKYCPTQPNSVLKEKDLKSINSLAFIGLPCHIHGMNNSKNYNPLKKINLFMIGLFCGGLRAKEATHWIFKKNNIPLSSVAKIQYRGDGWPGVMKIVMKDDKVKEIPYGKYDDQFFDSWVPWRCTICLDATAEVADISLGDAWRLPVFVNDTIGTSLIIARTEKGLELIEEAAKRGIIKISPLEVEAVLTSQSPLIKAKQTALIAIGLSSFFGYQVPFYGKRYVRELAFAWTATKELLIKLIKNSILRRVSRSSFLFKIMRFCKVHMKIMI